jgi:hypothetical protein
MQILEGSTKTHRLSTCGTLPIGDRNQDETTELATPDAGPLQILTPKELESDYLDSSDEDETVLRGLSDTPSLPESQEAFFFECQDVLQASSIIPTRTLSGVEMSEDQPQLVKSQPELSVHKIRSKLPPEKDIKRKLKVYNPASIQLPCPVRVSKETNVEAAVAQLEAKPAEPAALRLTHIGNTIGHFESLIAKDHSDKKKKYSIWRKNKNRIPPAASYQGMHRVSQPDAVLAEAKHQKISNTWGRRAWRTERRDSEGETGQYPVRGRLKFSRRHCESKHTPEDEPVEVVRKLPEEAWSLWADGPSDSTYGRKVEKSQPTDAAGHCFEYDAQQLRASSTTAAGNGGQLEPGRERLDHGEERRRSWRLSSRRWTSRSSTQFIASADCTLEQPQPVRINEMKRLVSLCRDRMTLRKERAQTD